MMNQTSTNSSNDMITTQPQQTIGSDLILNQMAVSSSTNNSEQHHTDVQRKQFIQKQLVLLLHAYKCQQRENQTINDETIHPSTCTLPHCGTMKNVLQHMTQCNDHKTCTIPHCVTSRQIILHWKQCNNSQCSICQPFKTPSTLAVLNQTINNININATDVPITINKEWQRRVTQEMRQHLVQKIITALIPIINTGTSHDIRIINLANYARRIENETFEIADSLEEYFYKLAEKIYKLQKELGDPINQNMDFN
ncbi:unnamed protein product [Rotaria sp. Silwood1]|nr:unnamed protein product [Rotaria sp. Silwood1]CAF1603428.1 unnamed protein product [Rotaria sp. Silwood1]CAF3715898.1 unnamed protein product [Rotaria sp. Silwood1]CAF3759936.1 unnamed protein product [Rotaria sp. Silwood1]CAF4911745.1 unnamed protein product [Rotaria sp. Silwood1]